jgi:vitamin B12 transporter
LNLLKRIYYILFLVAYQSAVLFSQSAISDSVTTGEILVTANRVRSSAMLSPGMVQVMGRNEILSLNGTKLSDALASADAVFIRDYGFNSGLKTVSLNSSQSEHALVLLNGVKLNSAQNSQYDADLLELDDVSRIEVLKGGSSALYGTEAIGGVINIITGSALKKPFSFNVTSEAGSYGLQRIFLKTMNRFKTGTTSSADLNLSYAGETARNNYGYDYFNGFSNVLRRRDNSDYRSHSINSDIEYKLDNMSHFKLFTMYNYHNRGIAGVDLGYPSSSSRQIDRDLISSLSYSRELSRVWYFNSSLDYKYSLMNYYDPQTFNLPQPLNDFYKLNTLVNSSAFRFSNQKVEINSGYEISYNTISSNETDEGCLLQTGIFSAGKFEFDKMVFSKVTLYPSVRYDYYSNIHKNVLSGKLGVNIKPFKEIDLAFKSSAGTNFRAPTFNELYWIGLGNKALHPEHSLSFDAGTYYGFSFLTDNILELSYFNTNTADRIVWTPDINGIYRPVNIGRVKAEGLDMSLRIKLSNTGRFQTEAGINYNLARAVKKDSDYPGDPTYDKQLAYLPQEYAKSSVRISYVPPLNFMKLIALNVFYTFTGKRYVDLGNIKYVPYYELIDGNINVTLNLFKTETTIKFSVNNLLDKDYQVISGYPMPLRNYRLQIGINY